MKNELFIEQMVWGKQGSHMEKIWVDLYLTLHQKLNSGCINRLNIRRKSYKCNSRNMTWRHCQM